MQLRGSPQGLPLFSCTLRGKPNPASKGSPLNYARLALASLGAIVAYFVVGFILLAALPSMKSEFLKYPVVYRSNEGMMKAMPYNMAGILISIVVVTVLYAKMYPTDGGSVSGILFGALIGVFAVCTYAVHNYTLLNIDFTLTLYESITYFISG
jgi:uncharacterized membrane protein